MMPRGNQIMSGKATTMMPDAKETVVQGQCCRMLRMLSDCNRILVHSTNESGLLGDLCRLLLDEGGCTAAWVGTVRDDAVGTVRTVVHVGFQGNIPATFDLMDTEDSATFESWVSQVIRTGQMRCCDDLNQIPGDLDLRRQGRGDRNHAGERRRSDRDAAQVAAAVHRPDDRRHVRLCPLRGRRFRRRAARSRLDQRDGGSGSLRDIRLRLRVGRIGWDRQANRW